jgi:hypothetical protein
MHLKKKNWDVANIASQLRELSNQCSSPYNDGFTAFELKKDLYQIKDLIEQAINRSPNFGELEQQWLTEQEQKRIIKILKS